MHEAETISIGLQNSHLLAGNVLALPTWNTPCHNTLGFHTRTAIARQT